MLRASALRGQRPIVLIRDNLLGDIMSELELYYEAMKLRKQYASRARVHASLQASRSLARGDLKGRDHWDKVRSVVGYLEQIDEQHAA